MPWNNIKELEEAKGYILASYLKGTPFEANPEILGSLNWSNMEVVLDCGCGIGRNWSYLFSHGVKKIIAYDYPNMKELTNKNVKIDGDVQWIHPPVENLTGISYDVILAALAFQHFSEEELRKLLKQLCIGLKKNGKLFVHGRGYLDDRKKNVWKIILDFFKVDPNSSTFNSENGTEDHQIVIFNSR